MRQEFDIGHYLTEGYNTFRENMAGFVVATILFSLLHAAAGLVPFIGPIVSFLVAGPLMGGLYILSRDAFRGEPVEAKRLFDAFEKFTPLFLVYVVSMMFALAPLGLFAAWAGVAAFALSPGETPTGAPVFGLLFGFIIITILIALFISACYLFVYAHVVDQDSGFWTAMEASRKITFKYPVKVLLFLLIIAVVNALGVLAFFVGFLFTFPYTICAITACYNAHFESATSSPRLITPSPPPPVPDEKGDLEDKERLWPSDESEPETQVSGALILVLVEGLKPAADKLEKIARLSKSKAFLEETPPAITGYAVRNWPKNDQEFAKMAKVAVKNHLKSMPQPYDAIDTSGVSIWKGRDKSSSRGMAVITLNPDNS